MYTDEELILGKQKYQVNPPQTKEALYFREIFEDLFPGTAETVDYWIPTTTWEGVKADPSGRAQNVHDNSTPN